LAAFIVLPLCMNVVQKRSNDHGRELSCSFNDEPLVNTSR
jgi:hypothetical protein